MNARELADELESLLPDLRHSRATHIQWRDCDQSWRDANPHIGSKEFHADAVADYDRRIEVINKAVKELRAALPEQPLAEKWRGEAGVCRNRPGNEPLHLAEAADIYEQCAADLDSHESESRELLRRIVIAADSFNGTRPDMSFEAHVHALGELMKAVDEARKHLGGDSDAKDR